MSGKARTIIDPWLPCHADPHAARLLLSRLPAERIGAARAMCFAAMRSRDASARSFAFLLLDAINDGDPDRVWRDAGLARAGGDHGVRGITDRALRDAALRQLARTVYYTGMSQLGIARAMISGFDRYESRCWPRDRTSGRWPQAGPEAVFCAMLRRGVKMPRTTRSIVAILMREI